MPTFEDLKVIDGCITSALPREDGFIEVRGVHHPYQVRKALAAEGCRFISFIPCGCQEAKRSKQRVKSKHSHDFHLIPKSKDHQGPRPRSKPPSHL